MSILDERKFRILQAIIDDYISTAMPVGSRTLSRKDGIGLSSATIRNEMSDLTELGYLDQPHTSAGRVPSWRAYRLYVDHLMRVSSLSPQEMTQIQSAFSEQAVKVEELMERAAGVLANLTNYTSIVLAPQLGKLRLKRVQLVPISDTAALVVVVTDLGVIKDTIVNVGEGLTPEHLYSLSVLLTEQLSGRTIDEIPLVFKRLSGLMRESKTFFDRVLSAIDHNMRAEEEHSVVMSGAAKLLSHPEYADIDKARSIMTALETREQLARLLAQNTALTFTVTIGPEMERAGLGDCSLVTVAYKAAGNHLGSMGVIGPTRMTYGRVVAVLDGIRLALGEALNHLNT